MILAKNGTSLKINILYIQIRTFENRMNVFTFEQETTEVKPKILLTDEAHGF